MAAKAPSDDAVGGVSQMTGLQFMIDDILLSLPVDEDGGTQFPSRGDSFSFLHQISKICATSLPSQASHFHTA